MESRRSSLPGSRIPNGSTSSASSSSSRGVLRQFRPAISDQWLSNDMKAVNRRSSLTNTTPNRSSANSSSGGLIKERRYHQYHHHHSNAQSVSRPVNSNGIPLPLSSAALSPSISAQSGKLTCPECLVVVDSIQDLEIHFQKRHSDAAGGSSSALLFCPHCSEAIKHRTNLHRHIRVKHDERTGRQHCRKCAFSCASVADLEKHKEKHRACPFCKVIMESGTGLAKHMQNCRHRISTRR